MGIKNMVTNHHTTSLYNLKAGDTFMLNNRTNMLLGTYQSDLKEFMKSCEAAGKLLAVDLITGELLCLNSCITIEPISVVLTEDLAIAES